MFGLFKPTCPVGASRKAWTDYRLAWLAQQFGQERLQSTKMLVPTDERFANFDHTEESARRLFDTIRTLLRIPANEIVLEFVDSLEMPEAAGLYQRGEEASLVWIAEPQLDHGQSLVATMAHELAHHVLMSAGHLPENMEDHEHATDLFAVYSGFGIFAANAVLQDETVRSGHISWWQIGRQGYLTAAEYGYALGVHSYVREERSPEWQQYLRLDARTAMLAAQKYIEKTGDCLYQRMYDRGTREPTELELLAELGNKFDGNRIAALWDVRLQTSPSTALLDAVIGNVRSKTEDVRAEAIRALAAFGPRAEAAIPTLVAALRNEEGIVLAELARAIGKIQADETTLPHLHELLAVGDKRVVTEAVQAIECCGPAAAGVIEDFQPVLRGALIDGHDASSMAVLSAISKHATDPEGTLRRFFKEDRDLRELALAALEEFVAKCSSAKATPIS